MRWESIVYEHEKHCRFCQEDKMAFKEKEMDNTRGQEIIRKNKPLLEQYKSERDYHKVQYDYFVAKVERLEKLEEMYRKEYGI